MDKGIELILILLTYLSKLTSFEVCGWDDSIAFSQLLGITRQDLASAPEAVFHTINGLSMYWPVFFAVRRLTGNTSRITNRLTGELFSWVSTLLKFFYLHSGTPNPIMYVNAFRHIDHNGQTAVVADKI
jgi:hypothetical protein